MKFVALFLAATLIVPIASAQPKNQKSSTQHSAAYNSAVAKFDHLQSNATDAPSSTPTQLSSQELNAYLNEGGVDLPAGVQSVKFASAPAGITATARVDFDEITSEQTSMNPLMSIFSGVHDVNVIAQAQGDRGMASVRVQSVELDGVKVPRMALQYLVDHYLRPKYGDSVGMNSTFRLPLRIDSAVVGHDVVTLVQK